MPKLEHIFRSRLKEILNKRGSKTILLKKSGLSQGSLYGYLRGDNLPALDTVQRIADALGIPALDLLREPEQLQSDQDMLATFFDYWDECVRRAQGDPLAEEFFGDLDRVVQKYAKKIE